MKPCLLITLCALASLQAPLASAQTPSHVSAAATVDREVRLARISVTEIGQGDPVVLIPGLATPRDVWSGIVPELARNRRVILVQVNGFGGDDKGTNDESGILPGMIEDLAAYLRERRVGKAAIVGHSMGGLVGLMMTRDHPELVDRLMVVDALPFFGMLFGPSATVETVRPAAEQMRTALLNGTAPTDAPATMSVSEAGRAQVTAWLRAADRSVVAQSLYEDFVTDIRPDLGRIGADRIDIVYGVPEGSLAPMVHALYREAYRALEGAKLVPVEGSAHFVMIDQPEPFLAAVKNFIAPITAH